MGKIKGPAIFLAQFLRDEAPHNNLENITKWASDLGYVGVQIPAWDGRVFDLEKAAESKAYCDDFNGTLANVGMESVSLGSYLRGQCLAFHPAYQVGFADFHPAGLKGEEVTKWASDQLMKSVDAAVNLGVDTIACMSGGFLWHMIYPWPQRPDGIVDEAFTELAARWKPILDRAAEKDISICYELHPGSDLYDGATFEMFLDKVNDHKAANIIYDPSHFVLQQLDYLEFIKIYGERIKAVHVKDAEFNPTGRVGVYGGYQGWGERAGRFRSLGDGQVDFKRMFTLLAEAGFDGWAILEWECAIKSSEQGAKEGAPFIAEHIIETTDVAFDDFVGGDSDRQKNRRMLGLEE
jgi:sugar phosphate isomerase/epimerase